MRLQRRPRLDQMQHIQRYASQRHAQVFCVTIIALQPVSAFHGAVFIRHSQHLQVSTQLQASMDQAKSFKAALKETTKMLESTEKTVKSLESQLGQSKSDGAGLQTQVPADSPTCCT